MPAEIEFGASNTGREWQWPSKYKFPAIAQSSTETKF